MEKISPRVIETINKLRCGLSELEPSESEKLVLRAAEMKSPELRVSRKKLLKKAASLGNLEAEFELGWMCVSAGDLAEATKHFQKSTSGGAPSAFAALAQVEEMQGDLLSAQRNFAQAAYLGLDVRLELARVSMGLGKSVLARNIYEELAGENSPEAINALGNFLQGEGKGREAEKRWKQAAKLGNLDAKANLGKLVIRSDFKSPRYMRYLNDAVDARHPGIVNMLGNHLATSGRLDDARRLWAISAAAGDENAHRNLAKLARENGDEELALLWETFATTRNLEDSKRLLEQHGLLVEADTERSDGGKISLPYAPISSTLPGWVFWAAVLSVSGLLVYFAL